MKLYDSRLAPNPRRARIFLAEKGITVPTEQVDIMTMQQRTPEYTAINPLQRLPALVLDDGTIITNRLRSADISKCCSPTRRCSVSGPKMPPLSKCGIDGRRSISSPTWRQCFATPIRR